MRGEVMKEMKRAIFLRRKGADEAEIKPLTTKHTNHTKSRLVSFRVIRVFRGPASGLWLLCALPELL